MNVSASQVELQPADSRVRHRCPFGVVVRRFRPELSRPVPTAAGSRVEFLAGAARFGEGAVFEEHLRFAALAGAGDDLESVVQFAVAVALAPAVLLELVGVDLREAGAGGGVVAVTDVGVAALYSVGDVVGADAVIVILSDACDVGVGSVAFWGRSEDGDEVLGGELADASVRCRHGGLRCCMAFCSWMGVAGT